MLEPLIYIVSAVLKAWHFVYAGLFSISASTSWLLSIISLLVTVRALIAPLSVRQYVTGRQSALIRPQIEAIRTRYRTHADPLAPNYQRWAIAELQRNNNVSVAGSLLPAFIQIPVIIGLYRLFQRIMHEASLNPPTTSVHPDAHVGFLDATDIASFVDSQLFGRPISAYLTMPSSYFRELGITSGEFAKLTVPLVFFAAIFTTVNIVISLRRYLRTYDFSSTFARNMLVVMMSLVVISPLFVLSIGLFGRAALAIIFYWVCNNLWTMTQNFLLTRYLERNYPLTDAFTAHRRELRDSEIRRAISEHDMQRLLRRKRRLSSIPQPLRPQRVRATLGQIQAEIARRNEAAEQTASAEEALAKKVRQYRAVVNLMRPRDQDYLPDLKSSDVSVAVPNALFPKLTMTMRRGAAAKPPRKRWVPTSTFGRIVWWIVSSLYGAVKDAVLSVVGKKPSQWRRFR